MIDTTIDSLKELVDKKLHIYHWYPIDGNNCKCAFTWWHMEEHMFPTIVILVRQIMGIPTFQNEIERFFSIFGILIAFCRCHFQQIFLTIWFLLTKIGQFNPCVGCLNFLKFAFTCKVKSNLMKKLDVKFEHEVECEEFPRVQMVVVCGRWCIWPSLCFFNCTSVLSL